MMTRGLSERRALAVLRMSASAYRYQPAPDRNVDLREQILALAQRYKRYGVGMIYLKLRQAGVLVNYKRVERLYQEAKLQVRRRKRKKVPVADRQPLLRPSRANEVWSMDFVFDRTADGRVLKALVIVDDATHELVAIEVERAISGHGVARILDRLAVQRESPRLSRRLQTLRGWSHEQEADAVFTGGQGARGADGVRAPRRARIAVGGNPVECGEDRLRGRDAAAVGSPA